MLGCVCRPTIGIADPKLRTIWRIQACRAVAYHILLATDQRHFDGISKTAIGLEIRSLSAIQKDIGLGKETWWILLSCELIRVLNAVFPVFRVGSNKAQG
jgi:hypothetical protein